MVVKGVPVRPGMTAAVMVPKQSGSVVLFSCCRSQELLSILATNKAYKHITPRDTV